MKQNDQVIILHRRNYSETSLIIKGFTKQFGLQSFIFKGGKKKAHALFPCSVCEIEFYKRPESDLLQLTAAQMNRSLQIQFHPIKTSISFFIAEIIQNCVHENQQDERMFEYLARAIHLLDESNRVESYPVEFMFNLTSFLGIQPQVNDQRGEYFSLEDGVIDTNGQQGIYVERGQGVEVIRSLCLGQEIDFNRDNREEALQLLIRYFQMHIPGFKEPESYPIVREVLRG